MLWNDGAEPWYAIKMGIAACEFEVYRRGALASYGASQAFLTSIRLMLPNAWAPAERIVNEWAPFHMSFFAKDLLTNYVPFV